MNAIELIRGLVRPIVTFVVILVLAVIVVYLVVKFADAEMAKEVAAAFMVLVVAVTAFWFGQRSNGTTPR